VRGGHGDRAGWAWVGAEVEVVHGRIGVLRSPEGSGVGVRGFTGCDFHARSANCSVFRWREGGMMEPFATVCLDEPLAITNLLSIYLFYFIYINVGKIELNT
jgi:hypothetical protein